MDLAALHRFLREGDSVSGAFLSVDQGRLSELYAALKETPGVAGVSVKAAVRSSFERTLAENLLVVRFFNVLFGGIIALGVVYNSARIALSERGRELATLRVLGFTRREIAGFLFGELGALIAAAIPFGMALGYGLAALMVRALDSETQRFPLVVRSSTFAWAAVIVLAAAVLSATLVRRRLDRLDLVAVLKSRE
jgi:putative ABC transport system permease protein